MEKYLWNIGCTSLGAKLIALKKLDGGLRHIAIGNTFRQMSAKCVGYRVFESRQARYGNRQVSVGFKRVLNWPHMFPLFDRKPPAQRKRIFAN